MGGCALRVPARCPFIPNPRHPSIASPVVTCFADPACIRNHSKWTLPVHQHPIMSGVLPAAALPRAVTSYVCIADLWARERKKHCVEPILHVTLFCSGLKALKCRNSLATWVWTLWLSNVLIQSTRIKLRTRPYKSSQGCASTVMYTYYMSLLSDLNLDLSYTISHDYQDRMKPPPTPSEDLYCYTSVDIYTSTPHILWVCARKG